MVNRISIKGFKKFDDDTLELKGLNVLAGKNSTGKSSVLHSLLVLNQDVSNPFNGDYVELGDVQSLRNYKIGAEEISISATNVCDDKIDEVTLMVDYTGASTRKGDIKGKVVYCSAERLGVEKFYEEPIQKNSRIGKRCEYSFSYLANNKSKILDDLFIYEPESLRTFEGQINYWLTRLTGYRIKAETIEQVDVVRVLYQDSRIGKNTNWIRPQNVGTGVTYVSEVLIAAFSCRKDDILIIENPEIHLHPEAQSQLLEFFSFIESCGVQIILETHSDHIFNGLRKCVHQNLIPLDEQAIFYFSEKENGCVKIDKVELLKDGKIINAYDGLFDQISKDLDIILGW